MHSMRVVFLLFILSLSSNGQYSDETWQEASTYLKSSMNATFNECKYFYKHVCGSFGKSDQGVSDDSETTAEDSSTEAPKSEFEIKQKNIRQQLLAAIQAIVPDQNATNATDPSYSGALRSFYDGCIQSEQTFPDQVLRRVYNALGERIGYLPILGGKGDKPARVMGTLTREVGQVLIIDPVVSQPEGASKPILYLYPVAATNSEYNASETSSLISALATVTGSKVKQADINKLVNELSAFYDDWQNITEVDRTTQTLRNSVANLTSSNLRRSGNAGDSLNDYLDGVLPEDTKKQWLADPSTAIIEISDSALIQDILTLIKRHSPETIFSFAFLDALTTSLSSNYDSSQTREALSIASGGTDRCGQFVSTYASSASARVLLEFLKIDPAAWRDEILLLAGHVKAAFRYLISSIDWLDSADKMKVSDRLDGIDFYPGLPSWIMDNAKLLAKTPKFDTTRTLYENEFDIGKQNWAVEMRQLVSGIDNEDPEPDFTVNGEYEAKTAKVNFGLTLPPTFKISYPMPLKYGGLGFVIAQQYFHAFDPDVVAEDEVQEGKSTDSYFKEGSMKEYKRRRSCVIQQYSKYCNKKVGQCVSGDSSVNNNIGDVDGLKVAYAAYKFVSQVLGGEPPVPGFVGRTGDQMFFIAFARLFCASKNKLQFLASAGAANPPPRARVDLPVANFPAFAASFHCPVGSTFAPLKKCSLWGESFAPTPVQEQSE